LQMADSRVVLPLFVPPITRTRNPLPTASTSASTMDCGAIFQATNWEGGTGLGSNRRMLTAGKPFPGAESPDDRS